MRLVDCFTELLAFAKQYLQQPTQDYSAFRARIVQLIGEAGARGLEHGFSNEECDAALFAVVAWLDEAVLSSAWSEVGRWQKEPLQAIYFRTARAGLEFFTRLDTLSPQQREIREVYVLCLLLGFKGRYVYQTDRGMLIAAQQKQVALLVDDPALLKLEGGHRLFPGAYPGARAADAPKGIGQRWSALTINLVVTPPVVALVLYLTYYTVLSRMAQDFSVLLK